jgi:hypothetical protein
LTENYPQITPITQIKKQFCPALEIPSQANSDEIPPGSPRGLAHPAAWVPTLMESVRTFTMITQAICSHAEISHYPDVVCCFWSRGWHAQTFGVAGAK